MASRAAQIRDIIIGLILIIVGGITLAHTFNIITFDENQAIMYAVYGLLALGGLLVLAYLFKPSSIWMLILALCMFFIAGAVYIGNFHASLEELIPTSLFLMAALGFFVFFFVKPEHWWALMTGWISLGLAATVYTDMQPISLPLLDRLPGNAIPPLMLFTGIFLGFFFVWLSKPRERWWALMTSGLVAAVATVIVLDAGGFSESLVAPMLFFVSGLTFFLVWMLKNEEYPLGWAIYPATVLLGFSVFIYVVTTWTFNSRVVLAVIFLVVGFMFIVNYFRGVMSDKKETARQVDSISKAHAAPAESTSPPVVEERRLDKTGERESLFQEAPSEENEPSQEEETTRGETFTVESMQKEQESRGDDAEDEMDEEEAARPPVDYAVDEDEEEDERFKLRQDELESPPEKDPEKD